MSVQHVEMQELRLDDVASAVSLLASAGADVAASGVRPGLSLLMRVDDRPVAAAVFVGTAEQGRLVVAASPEAGAASEATGAEAQRGTAEADAEADTEFEFDTGTQAQAEPEPEPEAEPEPEPANEPASTPGVDLRGLIDKALMKLHAAGVRRFAIDVVGAGDPDPLVEADFLRRVSRDRAA